MTTEHVELRIESEDFSTDQAQVLRMEGRERITALFDFEVSVAWPAGEETSRDRLVGAGITLVFARGSEVLRRVFGMVSEVVEVLDADLAERVLTLRVVPRAHRLALVETQETFLNLTIPEILQEKLSRVGLAGDDVELRLTSSYRKHSFVVQFRETDLAFVSRLCEHHGLSFHFDHHTGRDRIVFTDGASFAEHESRPRVPLRPRGEQRDVFRLEARSRVIPKTYAVDDYNYRTPSVAVGGSFDAENGFGGGVVEYGTHVKTPDEGEAYAKIRAEEREAGRDVYAGKSRACELEPGTRYTLDGQGARDDLPLVVVGVRHRASQVAGLFGGTDVSPYENDFDAIDASVRYRSPRVTPRPRIHGVLSGIIEETEGVSAKYAKLDDQGRYRVRMLFDSAVLDGRRASRPVRMAQQHAGGHAGTHFPLRPGVEVLLAFVDGDPDRPLIVGAVPNPLTPSPVVASSSLYNRIRTESGVLIEMKDA
jgi:type VI secretion system secreted protein VgrG